MLNFEEFCLNEAANNECFKKSEGIFVYTGSQIVTGSGSKPTLLYYYESERKWIHIAPEGQLYAKVSKKDVKTKLVNDPVAENLKLNIMPIVFLFVYDPLLDIEEETNVIPDFLESNYNVKYYTGTKKDISIFFNKIDSENYRNEVQINENYMILRNFTDNTSKFYTMAKVTSGVFLRDTYSHGIKFSTNEKLNYIQRKESYLELLRDIKSIFENNEEIVDFAMKCKSEKEFTNSEIYKQIIHKKRGRINGKKFNV